MTDVVFSPSQPAGDLREPIPSTHPLGVRGTTSTTVVSSSVAPIEFSTRGLSISFPATTASFSAFGSYSTEGLGDEKGWWCPSIDDSASDISNNGNDGTYNGGMGTVADTGDGGTRAYLFNGLNQYIGGLGQSDWDFINNTGNFTVSCWAKNSSNAPPTQQTLISTNYDSVAVGWGLYYNTSFGTRFDLTKATGGVFSAYVYDSTLSGLNQWKCYTATGDGTTLRLYVDGVLKFSAPFTGFTSGSQSNELSIGSYVGTALPYNGVMDDIRIFDRAITDDELAWLATERGIEGPPTDVRGLGDEIIWFNPSATNSYEAIDTPQYDGTAMGAVSIVSDTAFDGEYAYSFTGNDSDRIMLDVSDGVLQFINDTCVYSLSCWVKNTDTAKARTFFGSQINQYSEGYQFGVTPSSYRSRIRGNFGFDVDVTAGAATASSWVHFASVSDGTTVWHYENFTLVGTGAVSSVSGMGAYPSYGFIGGCDGDFGPLDEAMDGLVDDLRLFNRELTADELYFLSQGRTQYGPAPINLFADTGEFLIESPETPLRIAHVVDTSSYIIEGNPAVGLGLGIGASCSEYLITVTEVNFPVGIVAATVDYSITVSDAKFSDGISLKAETGVFIFFYFPAGRVQSITADCAVYELTVNPVVLDYALSLEAETGDYQIQVFPTVDLPRTLSVSTAIYSLVVNSANFDAGGNYTIKADTGYFQFTFPTVQLVATFGLICEPGQFNIVVFDAEQARSVSTGQFAITVPNLFSVVIFESGHASFNITVSPVKPTGPTSPNSYYFRFLLQGNQ